MSDAFIFLTFIVLPATLFSTVVFIIFKNKIYAIRSASLYLMVASTIMLISDPSIRTSFALIIGGATILLSTFLFRITSKKINMVLSIAVLVGIIFTIILYSLVSERIVYSLEYSIDENCYKNITTPMSLEKCRIYVNLTTSLPLNIPLEKEPQVYLCTQQSSYARAYAYHYKNIGEIKQYYIIVDPYAVQQEFKQIPAYLCVTYRQDYANCNRCMYEREIYF